MRESQIAFQPSWGRRIIGMEGLRALAAIGVLVGHTRVHMSSFVEFGPLVPVMYVLLNGLTLFFALSGFLLFRPFVSALLRGEKFPSIGRYASNRLLRIFPAYIVITLLVSLVLGTAYVSPQLDSLESSSDNVGYLTDPGLLAINMTMLQTLFPFSIKTGIGVAWSLSVELIFYVVMPLLAFAAWKLRNRIGGIRLALLPVGAMFLIGVAGKFVKWGLFQGVSEQDRFFNEWGGNWNAVFARSFPAHADLFAFGMLAAVLVAAFEAERIAPRLAPRFRLGSFVIAVVMLAASYVMNGDFKDTCLAIAFGAVILFVALPSRTGSAGIVAKSLDVLPLRYVGLVSYSLYLWHLPVIWLIVKLGWSGPETYPGFFWNLLLVFAISLTLASITYHFVEKPALALKKRSASRQDRARTPASPSVAKSEHHS